MEVIFAVNVAPGNKLLTKTLDLPFLPPVGTRVETEKLEGEVTVQSITIDLEKKDCARFRVQLSPVLLKSRKDVVKYVGDATRDRGWKQG